MGQTLGLIAFGHVARAVAMRAKPFGLRILAYDPFIEELVMSPDGVEPVGLRSSCSTPTSSRCTRRPRPTPTHADGGALPPDEADRDLHQHRPRADRRRARA